MDKDIIRKLNTFLDGYENISDVIGVLVCGSYVTGNANAHSDLDVHLILKDGANYRERGNRVVENLLIEYFANTEKQIRAYFESDYQKVAPMSQTQFATGKILRDDLGVVRNLKNEALSELDKKYSDVDCSLSPLVLYSIWDMLDDLQSIYEEDRMDFDFIYYNKLDSLLSLYFKSKKIPYNTKTVVGHLTSDVTRRKYLLEEIKDEFLVNIVLAAITSKDKLERLMAFTTIAQELLNEYNFNIENFTFKSKESM